MKKMLLASLALAILALSSCHKLKDFWEDHHNGPQSYRITKWTHDLLRPGDDAWTVGNFTYNSQNDPVTVVFDGTGPANWLFKYDHHHRLTETYRYSGTLPSADYDDRFKYVHNNLGQVIMDSFFINVGTSVPEWTFLNTGHYTYDAQGRITHVVRREDGDIIQQQEYTYDANGNLQKSGYTYDNKVNFLRTNKVWQFINRDYSRNNAFPTDSIPGATYNNAGLPVTFNYDHPPSGDASVTFLERLFNHSTFIYKKVD